MKVDRLSGGNAMHNIMQTVKPAETDRYLITVSKEKQWRTFAKDRAN